MICGGIVGDETQLALAYLYGSQMIYQITGSRFFGNATEQSDYDFFTEYSKEVATDLEANGFKRDNSWYIGDPALQMLYKRGSVQIQLVNDAPKKEAIQKAIKHYAVHIYLGMSKRDRRKLWQMLYAVA